MKRGARSGEGQKQTRAATGDSMPKELYSQSHFVGMQGMQPNFKDPGAYMRKPDAFPVDCILTIGTRSDARHDAAWHAYG